MTSGTDGASTPARELDEHFARVIAAQAERITALTERCDLAEKALGQVVENFGAVARTLDQHAAWLTPLVAMARTVNALVPADPSANSRG